MRKTKIMTIEELTELNRAMNSLHSVPKFLLERPTEEERKMLLKDRAAAEKQIKGIEKTLLTHLTHLVKTKGGIQALEGVLKNCKAALKTEAIGDYGVAKAYARLAIEMSALEQTRDVEQAKKLIDEDARNGMKELILLGEGSDDEKVEDFYKFACDADDDRAGKVAAQILRADGLEITGPDVEQE